MPDDEKTSAATNWTIKACSFMGGQTRLATITAVSPASDNQKLDTASEAAVSDPCGFESLEMSEPTALEQDEQGVWSGTTNRIW